MNKELKKAIIISGIVIFATLILCGCQGTEVEEDETNVFFESDIVDLLDYDIEFNQNNNNEVNQVVVTGRIQNKLKKMIDLELKADFYDKDDNYLGEKIFTIVGLRSIDNPGHSTTFTITYEDKTAKIVDYVRLTASEI